MDQGAGISISEHPREPRHGRENTPSIGQNRSKHDRCFQRNAPWPLRNCRPARCGWDLRSLPRPRRPPRPVHWENTWNLWGGLWGELRRSAEVNRPPIGRMGRAPSAPFPAGSAPGPAPTRAASASRRGSVSRAPRRGALSSAPYGGYFGWTEIVRVSVAPAWVIMSGRSSPVTPAGT